MIAILKDPKIDTDISVIMSTGRDARFGRHRPLLAMAAPSHRVGRGNFKLKNKLKDNVYRKIKHRQAIRDVRIEVCKSS